jgi:hypothetical protein
MSIRRLIATMSLASVNVSAFCREHDVSRDTFYEIRRRFEEEGEAGLQPRSRAPKRVANRTCADVEDLIVRFRKQLDDQGLDAGPISIHDALDMHLPAGTSLPSPATIYRILCRRGLVVADASKRPGRPPRRFAADRANECWQFDVTHWQLENGANVEIINGLDDCSRLAVACVVVTTATLANVWEAVCRGASRWSWPERCLTDNGTVFGPTFQANLAALGVGLRHSRPYHPQTCGKVERFHQTLKRWLSAHDPAPTIAELQTVCDAFIAHYNHHRRHRAIGRRIPVDVWHTTAKSGPATQPLELPTNNAHHSIHHARVANGTTWAAGYRITIGAAHNGAATLTVITGDRAHVFIDGRLIRALTLDRTRQNQPLHNRPGRPT